MSIIKIARNILSVVKSLKAKRSQINPKTHLLAHVINENFMQKLCKKSVLDLLNVFFNTVLEVRLISSDY